MKIWHLIKQSFIQWKEDNAPRLGAALAYYTVFSIGPFFVVLTAIAGTIFGKEAVQGRLMGQLKSLIGIEGADAVQALIAGAYKGHDSVWAAVIGVIVLLLGASGIFGQLEDALNTIWKVKQKNNAGLLNYLKERFASFTIVFSMGFLLIVSLALSTFATALTTSASNYLPGSDLLIFLADTLISFAIISSVFAFLLRFLPDTEVPWKYALKGGAFTCALFFIGKILIGIYLGNSNITATYGVAASVIILLLWIYYSAQIFLLGAEFTKTLQNSNKNLDNERTG